jgi:hypothetical protein
MPLGLSHVHPTLVCKGDICYLGLVLGSHEGKMGIFYSISAYTVVPPYPRVIRSKTYRGYVKPRIIPKAIQGVYKRMVRFQKIIQRLHSTTGRCSPHFHRNVRELLNRGLQQRWIGRAANADNHIHMLYGTNSIIVWMCVV